MMKHKSSNDRMAIPLPLDPPSGGSAANGRRSRRGEIMAELAAELSACHELGSRVVRNLFQALRAEHIVDAIVVFLVGGANEGMKLAYLEGLSNATARRRLALDFGQAICGNVAATGRAMHVADIQGRLDPIADFVRSAGITAYVCEPLRVGDRLFGTISFASRTRRSFDVEDLLFFRSVAEHLAPAIECAGLPAL